MAEQVNTCCARCGCPLAARRTIHGTRFYDPSLRRGGWLRDKRCPRCGRHLGAPSLEEIERQTQRTA
jgi:hypothetical protein